MKKHIAALILLAAPIAKAADPISITIAFVGAVAGVVSMVSNVARIAGDYEEIMAVLHLKYHFDLTSMTYQNTMAYNIRMYWTDMNGNGQYKTEAAFATMENGQMEIFGLTQSSTPFQHLHSRHQYTCYTSSGSAVYYDQSDTHFAFGYEVPKPANNSAVAAPNPVSLNIKMWGRDLFSSCQQPESVLGNRYVSIDVSAQRRGFTELSFPCGQAYLDTYFLTPRL